MLLASNFIKNSDGSACAWLLYILPDFTSPSCNNCYCPMTPISFELPIVPLSYNSSTGIDKISYPWSTGRIKSHYSWSVCFLSAGIETCKLTSQNAVILSASISVCVLNCAWLNAFWTCLRDFPRRQITGSIVFISSVGNPIRLFIHRTSTYSPLLSNCLGYHTKQHEVIVWCAPRTRPWKELTQTQQTWSQLASGRDGGKQEQSSTKRQWLASGNGT